MLLREKSVKDQVTTRKEKSVKKPRLPREEKNCQRIQDCPEERGKTVKQDMIGL